MQGAKTRAVTFCVALAIVFMVAHFWLGWQAAISDAETHGESATIGEYALEWGRDTVENIQSEAWQLALQFAILAGVLRKIGVTSYEEDQEEIKERLDRMERSSQNEWEDA